MTSHYELRQKTNIPLFYLTVKEKQMHVFRRAHHSGETVCSFIHQMFTEHRICTQKANVTAFIELIFH